MKTQKSGRFIVQAWDSEATSQGGEWIQKMDCHSMKAAEKYARDLESELFDARIVDTFTGEVTLVGEGF